MKLFYRHEYASGAHNFATTRKARWVAESLQSNPMEGVEITAPDMLDPKLLSRIHGEGYIEAVRTGEPRSLAQSQGFPWDPMLWTMTLASNGGAVASALEACNTKCVSGSLSSGLHHAGQHKGDGYCTFNGLALAAKAAEQAGARNILLLDFDAHCGNGTNELIHDHKLPVTQIDISTDPWESYDPSEGSKLLHVKAAKDYLPVVEQELSLLKNDYDLCLYNAGMDPHEDCTIGGLRGITAEILFRRDLLVFSWCKHHGIPVAFVIAGGYIGPNLSIEQLVSLHRGTIKASMM